MEKPHLDRSASGTKVPLILSDAGQYPLIQVPGSINQYLRDYQRDGIQFLYRHYKRDAGAILADDMGLGKTVQVIGFLAAILGKTGQKAKDLDRLRPHFIRKMENDTQDVPERGVERGSGRNCHNNQPFLVIGPASVLYNWLDEFDTWGYFSVGKYHKQYKQQTMADILHEKLDVVMTTYETCRDQIEELCSVKWNAVFADEVHRIKATNSGLTQALKRLPCRRRYGLSGTPLQNRLTELWCVMDWANPSCFGDFRTFYKKYVVIIERGQKLDVTKRQRAEANKAQQNLLKAHSKFLLRRTKDLIADQLPHKDDLVVYCRPTDLETDIYESILEDGDMKYVLMQKHKCSCGSGKTNIQCHYKISPSGVPLRSLTMTLMHLLLKAANNIALLMPGISPSGKQQQYANDICKRVFERHAHLADLGHTAAFRTLSDPKYCGKMKVLQGLLTIYKKKQAKVLLFSYSTKLLDILEAYVMSVGYEYRRMDGSTPGAERISLVRDFNREPNIFLFLISTKSGGVGLNLTGANVVIIYDPNWNPAHDLQAQDRAYRLGQRRDVKVFRLISSRTIEENIYLRQVFKQQMGKVALEKKNVKRLFCGELSAEERRQRRNVKDELFGLENLFRLRTGNSCLTEEILLRSDKLEAELKGYNIGSYVNVDQQLKNKRHLNFSSGESKVKEEEEVRSFDGHLSDDQDSSEAELSFSKDNLSFAEDSSSSEDSPSGDESSSSSREEENSNSTFSSSSVKNEITRQETSNPSMRMKSEKRRSSRTKNEARREADGGQGGQGTSCFLQQPTLQTIGDVLDQDDVVHLHQNKNLIRGSRVEDYITNCALVDVFELHQNTQQPVALCRPISDSSGANSSSDSDDGNVLPKTRRNVAGREQLGPRRATRKTTKDATSQVIGNSNVLVGQTPVGIRRQQFEELATSLGMKSATELAELVIGSDHQKRKDLLRHFYTSNHPQLGKLFEEVPNDHHPLMTTESTESRKRTSTTQKSEPSVKRPRRTNERKHSSLLVVDQMHRDARRSSDSSKGKRFTHLKNSRQLDSERTLGTGRTTSKNDPSTRKVNTKEEALGAGCYDFLETFFQDSGPAQQNHCPLSGVELRSSKDARTLPAMSSNCVLDEFLNIRSVSGTKSKKRKLELTSELSGKLQQTSPIESDDNLLKEILF